MKGSRLVVLAGTVVVIAACSRNASVASPAAAAAPAPVAPNTLTEKEKADGWRLLFDGTSLKNFRDFKADTLSAAWHVVDGVITKTRGAEDMVTREKFDDFEFAWDWKLSPRGNSGVFFRATEEYDKIYWSAIEFQLLDDSLASDNKDSTHLAGAAYGFYMPPRHIAKIGGNWNSSKIVARGNHIEHWMNGVRTLAYDIGTPAWDAMVAQSKFRPYPNFAKTKSGIIGFQGDHPGSLELRNLKIRVLK